MRRTALRWLAPLVLLPGFCCQRALAQTEGDNLPSRLGLADLAAYRAALAGRATVDDPRASTTPLPVSFRQLWDAPQDWRGYRVRVEGRIARVFRQEAVGGFPPLVEAWLSTPAGDLFCTVFPANGDPKIGQTVAFAGTYLKSIRYPAGDQARLAPLIVGDRSPEPVATSPRASPRGAEPVAAVGSPVLATRRSMLAWALASAAALAAAGLLAWYHLRSTTAPSSRRWKRQAGAELSTPGDPPLEFIEQEHDDGFTLS